MLPYRALILAVVMTSSPAWAYQKGLEAKLNQPSAGGEVATPLVARQPLPKRDYVSKPLGESRLCIKFRDEVKARVQPNNKVMLTAGAMDSNALDLITEQFNIKFVSKGNVSLEKLAALEARAAAHSGRAQPDLAGMMYIEGPDAMLEAAANALKSLDIVEYVYFQVPWRPIGGPPVPGACCLDGVCTDTTSDLCLGTFFPGETCANAPCPGACCIEGVCDDNVNVTQALCDAAGGTFFVGDTCLDFPCPGACCVWSIDLGQWDCVEVTLADCEFIGGVFRGGLCQNEDCEIECGDEELASCFVEHPYPMCNDVDCCELIGVHRPSCSTAQPEAEWDFICVAFANFYCDTPPGEPDPCVTPLASSCFIAHGSPGCIDSDCCHAVCEIDAFCCQGVWDIVCVGYAWQICTPPTGDDTPDLTSAQGYLRPSSYDNQFQGPPAGVIPPQPPPPPIFLLGWGGEGFDLFAEGPTGGPKERWADDPSMPAPQRYGGLYGLGRELNEVYGIGSGNLARGETIKVAVIEWAYHQNHEDLDVISEPGQTLIVIPDVTSPDHATACLGIINAQDNGFGMVGIAPDAQAYFFPLTSVEEGPREFAAFINCIDTLDPGDVISCSFGPGGSNLINEEDPWTWIRLAGDLGITVCVAAGNDCNDLSELTSPELGDSGGILVGACTPGEPYCRIDFSNYSRGTNITSSRFIHLMAWGTLVASTGYGDLFYDGSARAYTQFFGGTSAATPQVAGVTACLQGLAKQFYGIPLPTAAPAGTAFNNFVRSSMLMTGIPQCFGAIQGFDAELDCGFDLDPQQPNNPIGLYPQPRVAGGSVLTQWNIGFDESPLLKNYFILRGVQNFGNLFSLKGRDNNYLVVRSQYTDRGHVPALSSHSAEANFVSAKAKYLTTAFHSDVMVRIASPVKQAGTMAVSGEVNTDSPFSLMMFEAFDWTTNKWAFVGFQYPLPVVPQGDELTYGFVSTPGTKYINPSTLNAWIRVYVFTPGAAVPDWMGGGSDTNVGPVIRFDWINANFSGGFGQPIGGGGGGGLGG
jgi:hypothetical protein